MGWVLAKTECSVQFTVYDESQALSPPAASQLSASKTCPALLGGAPNRVALAFTLTDRRREYKLKKKRSCSEKHMCGLGVICK